MERRQFTDEFKREAVRLASQPGISKAEISEELGINVLICFIVGCGSRNLVID